MLDLLNFTILQSLIDTDQNQLIFLLDQLQVQVLLLFPVSHRSTRSCTKASFVGIVIERLQLAIRFLQLLLQHIYLPLEPLKFLLELLVAMLECLSLTRLVFKVLPPTLDLLLGVPRPMLLEVLFLPL